MGPCCPSVRFRIVMLSSMSMACFVLTTKKGMDTQNYFPLQIGRWTEETSGWVIKDGRHRRSYKGWVDDFRVYDAALSETRYCKFMEMGPEISKLSRHWRSTP